LTVSEALTRWFELEWVKENYEAASKFGTPKVMAGKINSLYKS